MSKKTPADNTQVVEVKPVKMGRPKIELDWEEFDKLCLIQATLREIAFFFDCSEDIIEQRVKEEKHTTFSEYWGQKRLAGFISLRRKQYQIAEGGDRTMLIWLGKNWMGQSDRQEVVTKGSNQEQPVEIPWKSAYTAAVVADKKEDEKVQ